MEDVDEIILIISGECRKKNGMALSNDGVLQRYKLRSVRADIYTASI
jgi:hypothetical protein